MAFTFDQVFAADPANPSNIAQNAAITIFAPGDGTMTPLTITDPDGAPLANPITVNANGFASAFAHETLDRVAWAGGGFTGFFTSYEGMKNEAVAARDAALDVVSRANSGEFMGATGAAGAKGADGSNVLPTDTAIRDAINNTASATRGALDATVGLISGVVDDDATDNRAAIQAALDQGGVWRLPATSGRYAIAGTLNVTVPGTRVLLHGAPIRQLTNLYGVFNVYAADCEIDGLDAIGSLTTPDFAGTNTLWQGSIIASRWTAITIYTHAHRLRIPYVRARNMSAAVRCAGWNNLTDLETTTTVDDVEIGLIVVDGVEFGFAGKATRRIKIGTAKGTYGNITNRPRAPHLVYFADDLNLVHHYQVSVGDVLAVNGEGGHAAQFKGIIGGEIKSVQATGCLGSVNIMDNTDLIIDTIISLGDLSVDVYGSIALDQTTTLERVIIRYAKVHMATNGIPLRFTNGTDCRIDHLDAIVAHTTQGAGTVYDVELRGTRNTLGMVNLKNTGANAWRAVGVFSGTGHRVTVGTLENVRVGVDVRLTDAIVNYDPDRITLHGTDGYSKTAGNDGFTGKLYARQTTLLTGDPATLVADNFTLPVGSTKLIGPTITGKTWTQLTGTWIADDTNRRAYESGGVANGAAVVDAGAANAAVEVFLTSQNSEGLILRATDASNYLTVRLHRTTNMIDIMKRVAGTNTVLSSTAVTTTAGRRYRLRADIYGAEVKVYLDGVLIVTYTLTGGDETTFASQTKHGLRSNVSTTARFDSFRVLSLS